MPEDLVMSRSPVQGQTNVYPLNPNYFNLFVSGSAYCPIISFGLFDTSDVALTNPSMTLSNPNSASNA
jgi:hypothetical protein